MFRGIAITLALGLCISAFFQVQGSSSQLAGRTGGPVWSLVLEKPVQTELKVSDDQAAKLKEWSETFTKKIPELQKSIAAQLPASDVVPAKGGLSSEDRLKISDRSRAMSSALHAAAFKELQGILKKEQVDRLKQIVLQGFGIGAFDYPEVATALKLSDDQKSRLRNIRLDLFTEQEALRAELRKTGRLDAQTLISKTHELAKDHLKKAVDMLSADQKKTWNALLGEPFDKQ